MWYSYGVAAYLCERWGDELADGVSFEGVSGGCGVAWSLAMHTKNISSVTEFAEIGIDGCIRKNQEDGWLGLWCWRAIWNIADTYCKHARKILRERFGHENYREALDDRCVFVCRLRATILFK